MKKNLNLEIGERVRIARTARGFSREQLAEMLNISALFLGYIECGQRGMSLSTLQNMCKTLNVSADYLLLGKENSVNSFENVVDAVKEIDPAYYPVALESLNSLKKIIAITNQIKEQDKK